MVSGKFDVSYGSREFQLHPSQRIALALDAICVVELSDVSYGTGVLIAADLVLTNYHVVEALITGEADPAKAHCRFDYHEGRDGALSKGWTARIVDFKIAWSPNAEADASDDIDNADPDKLDYAIIRVKDDDGKLSGRRLIPLPSDPRPLRLRDMLYIYHHPENRKGDVPPAQPLKENLAAVSKLATYRLLHTGATLPGSSGAACFNDRGELVALHQAGDPRGNRDNEATHKAIPIGRIVDDIYARYRPVYGAAVDQKPPPLKSIQSMIEARVDAANILMDRTDPELFYRDCRARAGTGAAPLVHFFLCRDGARPAWFINRLASVTLPVDEPEAARLEMLRKALATPAWRKFDADWPLPGDHTDSRRLRLLTGRMSEVKLEDRWFFLFTADIDKDFDPARERALIEQFALACAGTANLDASRFQAAVVFRAVTGEAEALFARFAELWPTDAPPPHCGLCETLGDIEARHLTDWGGLLTRAWDVRNDAINRDILLQFNTLRKQSLDRVARGLQEKLECYIKTYLEL